MFDDELEKALGSTEQLTALVADNHARAKLHDCRRLVLAAAWADAYADPDDRPDVEPGGGSRRRKIRLDQEGFVQLGGSGTPWLAETCAAEFGVVQQLSIGSARCLIADALDLRHRLPRLWDRVLAGEVHAWKARQVAVRSRYLGPIPVAVLDQQLSHQLELVPWARFEKILDAALLHVDPVTYGQRAEEAKTRRDVWAADAAEGLRTLIIRACQGDTAVFLAAVNRVADLLADEGDEDPIGARRAKAVGILGNPAAALDLLNRHVRQSDIYEDSWGYGPNPNETDPWDQASSAGWADRRSRFYDQPRADDADYLTGQREPAGEPSDSAEPESIQEMSSGRPGPIRGPAHEPPADDLDAPDPDEGTPHHRLLPAGGLSLREVTPKERDASRPRCLIVFHLTDQAFHDRHGVVRTDAGPITVDELRQFLTDSDAKITLQPVVDPAAMAPIDSYEIPVSMRRAMDVRQPASVFPFGGSRSGRMDLDHTRPFVSGGPPGQTVPANLGPLSRSEHRAKTVGRWTVRQPDPGTYLWRSPNGWISLVTNQGTMMLGGGGYARRIWDDASRVVARAA